METESRRCWHAAASSLNTSTFPREPWCPCAIHAPCPSVFPQIRGGLLGVNGDHAKTRSPGKATTSRNVKAPSGSLTTHSVSASQGGLRAEPPRPQRAPLCPWRPACDAPPTEAGAPLGPRPRARVLLRAPGPCPGATANAHGPWRRGRGARASPSFPADVRVASSRPHGLPHASVLTLAWNVVFLAPGVGGVLHQASSVTPVGVLPRDSVLTLSTWRRCHIAPGEGSGPQRCSSPTSEARYQSTSSPSPVLLPGSRDPSLVSVTLLEWLSELRKTLNHVRQFIKEGDKGHK